MERPIGGVLVTSGIIFMMEFTWKMILEMVTNHGKPSLYKIKRSVIIQGLLPHLYYPVHPQQEPLTSGSSNCQTNFMLPLLHTSKILRIRWTL